MKINSIDTKNYTNNYRLGKVQAAQAYQAAAKTDKVEISTDAQSFASAIKTAKAAMETQDPMELNRVRAVTEEIRRGTYHVDGVAIAEKMLEGILSRQALGDL